MTERTKWWCPSCAIKRNVLVTAPAEITERPACPDCAAGMVRMPKTRVAFDEREDQP